MRNRWIKVFYCIIFFCMTTDVSAELLKRIQIGNARLCYPYEYSPTANVFDLLQAPANSRKIIRRRSELINIPASEIKTLVPEYIMSHKNTRDIEIQHVIKGKVFNLSKGGSMIALAEEAWSLRNEEKPFFIEKDPENGFYRLYEHNEPMYMWHLVKTPVPTTKGNPIPDDWHIGLCIETGKFYECTQEVTINTLVYEYHIDQNNIPLRQQIGEAIQDIFAGWEKNCIND